MSRIADIHNINTSDVEPKTYTDKRCAPTTFLESGSCIKLHVLVECAKAYNKENNNRSIKLYPNVETLNPKKYKKYLLKEMKDRISTCSTQKCWTEQSFIRYMDKKIREEFEKYTFRPDGPDGRFEWLNTININDVMGQYEKKYQDFKFLGAVPMDFDELPALGVKNLDFNKLVKEGKTKLGIVFNLDEHYKPGSHWTAMFADLKKGEVKYFDSYGINCEPRVRKLMRKIVRFMETGMGLKNTDVDYNKIRHQFENSECGVYSINFILRMLNGESFESIVNKKMKDKEINKCRNVYFNNPNIQ